MLHRLYSSVITNIAKKTHNSKFGKRVYTAVFWSMFGAVFQKFLLLLSSFICIRILGKEQFGQLGIIRSTIQVFILFGAVGMGSTATKFIAEFREKDTRKMRCYYSTVKVISIISAVIVTCFILLFGKELALYLEDVNLTLSIRIGALLLFFSILNSIQTGILAGLEDFKHIAIVSIVGGAAEFLCIVIGSFLGSVNGALIGYSIGFLIITALNEYYIRLNKDLRVDVSSINKADTQRILVFSIPLLGASLLVMPVMWYVQTMLVKTCGFAESAIYTAADQWRMVLLFIPSALSRVILPMLSNVLSSDDQNDFSKLLKINFKINAITTTAIFLLFLLVSPVIIYLYGFPMNTFPVFAFLTGSTLFSCLTTVAGQAITSRSKTWIVFLFNIMWGVMLIAFARLFLTLGMKATAISLAMFITYLIYFVVQFSYLYFNIKSTATSQC